MLNLLDLWAPAVASALGVWFTNSFVYAALPHHKSDFKSLPNETTARKALKPQNIGAGQYNIPHLPSYHDAKKPDYIRKFEEGPVAFITVLPRGMQSVGKGLGLSLLYYFVVSLIVAYIAASTLDASTSYAGVFRVAATTAWLAYGWAMVPEAIWYGRPWKAIVKQLADSALYALVTAAIFGWLWPA